MSTRLRVRIHYDAAARSYLLLTLAGCVALGLLYLFWGKASATNGVQILEESANAPAGGARLRQYYLSYEDFFGSEPKNACSTGYHMASLWEILDTSNLRYNPNLGTINHDSGQGPPSGSFGWVRTGHGSDNDNVPGNANCNTWSSTFGYGSVAGLPNNWTAPAQQDVSIWDTGTQNCGQSASVWCVADAPDGPGSCTAPQTIFCGQTVQGTTAGLPSHLINYDCEPFTDESGPERLYLLALGEAFAPYDLTVRLTNIQSNQDLDLFLLSAEGCRAGECATLDSSSINELADEEIALTGLPGGSYYIAVDGFAGDAGSYTLSVECGYQAVFLPLLKK